MCTFRPSAGDSGLRSGAFVCSWADLCRNLRGLADFIGMSDGERGLLNDAVLDWIDYDWRSQRERIKTELGQPA